MKIVDLLLRHMTDVVATYIMLHNMCTIGKDNFDIEWLKEVERKLSRRIDNKTLIKRQEMRVEIAAIGEVRNISIS